MEVYRDVAERGGNVHDIAAALGKSPKTADKRLKDYNLSLKCTKEKFEKAYNQVAEKQGNTDDLADLLKTTVRSVRYYYKKYDYPPLYKKRGGPRVCDVSDENVLLQLMRKQQRIDSRTISFEVHFPENKWASK